MLLNCVKLSSFLSYRLEVESWPIVLVSLEAFKCFKWLIFSEWCRCQAWGSSEPVENKSNRKRSGKERRFDLSILLKRLILLPLSVLFDLWILLILWIWILNYKVNYKFKSNFSIEYFLSKFQLKNLNLFSVFILWCKFSSSKSCTP